MSVVVTIADAVVAALTAATLSQPFAVARAYAPQREEDDLTDLVLTVVPRGLTITAETRASEAFAYQIDVAVQRRLSDRLNSSMDPYMFLVQEVIDLFRGRKLEGYEAAHCTAAANDPIYAPEHLDEWGVFTSVVTFTFSLSRLR